MSVPGLTATSTGSIRSKSLLREVHYRLAGTEYLGHPHQLHIVFNDGQDFPALRMQAAVHQFNQRSHKTKLIVAGIDCGDRINEYGTVARPDYRNRGRKALRYEQFITKEFLPHMQDTHGFACRDICLGFAGCSLGGLSAFDLTVRHPELFRFAGIFSGSFWWRHQPFSAGAPDDHRIMHDSLEEIPVDASQFFWFEAGTRDEMSDRNGNGIIDAIDDTLSLISILERKGVSRSENIEYLEVIGGTHDPFTWGTVLPHFFNWIASRI